MVGLWALWTLGREPEMLPWEDPEERVSCPCHFEVPSLLPALVFRHLKVLRPHVFRFFLCGVLGGAH